MLLLYISDRFPSFSRIIQIVTQISNEYYMIVFITSLKNKRGRILALLARPVRKMKPGVRITTKGKKKIRICISETFPYLREKAGELYNLRLFLSFSFLFFFSPIFLSFFLSFLNETLHDVRWTIVVGRRNCDDSITMNIP